MKANRALLLVFIVLILLRRASDQDVEGQAGSFRLAPANEECVC